MFGRKLCLCRRHTSLGVGWVLVVFLVLLLLPFFHLLFLPFPVLRVELHPPLPLLPLTPPPEPVCLGVPFVT
jgi:hypothetical protein